ncbi:Calcium-binding EF-hand [Corchorus capsularis]|uniref:Calcium-binding EF-hand n=1 Tax=Corchorus capsularis TaxID=210143 RepID=A0A1R3HF72_COCAP|nr:Calcium-binding EF-hand [Corchorus capsularis]
MDEFQETALAYYANLPKSKKEEAIEFFRSLDRNGDGKISIQEYKAALTEAGAGATDIAASLGLFKELDNDGNGTLDFDEVMTLFYLMESGRGYSCDGCGAFLKGVYFTCLTCFNSKSNSFDLCCSCCRNNNFNHHHDIADLVDNFVLLHQIRKIVSTSEEPTPDPDQKSSLEQAVKVASTTSSLLDGFFQFAEILGNLTL